MSLMLGTIPFGSRRYSIYGRMTKYAKAKKLRPIAYGATEITDHIVPDWLRFAAKEAMSNKRVLGKDSLRTKGLSRTVKKLEIKADDSESDLGLEIKPTAQVDGDISIILKFGPSFSNYIQMPSPRVSQVWRGCIPPGLEIQPAFLDDDFLVRV